MTTLPKSLLDNPLLGTWIGFEEAGRVRLATGKVEIGQGVLTALAQIAAEELDVSPARLRIVSGETRQARGRAYLSSNSIAISGRSVRPLVSPRYGRSSFAMLRIASPARPGRSPSRRPFPARGPPHQGQEPGRGRGSAALPPGGRRCGAQAAIEVMVGQRLRLDTQTR